MHNSRNQLLRSLLVMLFGLFALPALGFGGYLLMCSLRIHITKAYYVEYPYLVAGITFSGLAAISLLCSIFAVWRRSFFGLLYAVPVVIALVVVISIPDAFPHVTRSMLEDTNYLSDLKAFLDVWSDAHGKFPSNKAELLHAQQNGPVAWQFRVRPLPTTSPYSQNGNRLPYDIEIVNNAQGPRLDNLSKRPGIIYYCVSRDQRQFWITMTGLSRDVAQMATLKRVADLSYEKPWLLTSTVKDSRQKADDQ